LGNDVNMQNNVSVYGRFVMKMFFTVRWYGFYLYGQFVAMGLTNAKRLS